MMRTTTAEVTTPIAESDQGTAATASHSIEASSIPPSHESQSDHSNHSPSTGSTSTSCIEEGGFHSFPPITDHDDASLQ